MDPILFLLGFPLVFIGIFIGNSGSGYSTNNLLENIIPGAIFGGWAANTKMKKNPKKVNLRKQFIAWTLVIVGFALIFGFGSILGQKS